MMICVNKDCKNKCKYYVAKEQVPFGRTVQVITGDGVNCPIRYSEPLLDKEYLEKWNNYKRSIEKVKEKLK